MSVYDLNTRYYEHIDSTRLRYGFCKVVIDHIESNCWYVVFNDYSDKDAKILHVILQQIGNYPDELKYQMLNRGFANKCT